MKIDNYTPTENNYRSSIPDIPKDVVNPDQLLLFVQLAVFEKFEYTPISESVLYEIRLFVSDILQGYVSPADIDVSIRPATTLNISIPKHLLQNALDVLVWWNRYLA